MKIFCKKIVLFNCRVKGEGIGLGTDHASFFFTQVNLFVFYFSV